MTRYEASEDDDDDASSLLLLTSSTQPKGDDKENFSKTLHTNLT